MCLSESSVPEIISNDTTWLLNLSIFCSPRYLQFKRCFPHWFLRTFCKTRQQIRAVHTTFPVASIASNFIFNFRICCTVGNGTSGNFTKLIMNSDGIFITFPPRMKRCSVANLYAVAKNNEQKFDHAKLTSTMQPQKINVICSADNITQSYDYLDFMHLVISTFFIFCRLDFSADLLP